MSTAERILTGARWSSAVICARKPVYEHQAAPQEPLPDFVLRRFKRGNAWGRIIRDDIVGAFRAQNRRPVAEVEVPWPAADPVGVGHADIYIPHERHIIEVFSTAGTGFPAHKGLQAAGYAVNHPRAEEASVLVVDRETGDERIYPLELDVLEPQVHALEAQVVEGIRGGDMPPRAAAAPFAFPCSECQFAAHCWRDWEPEPIDQVPEAADDALALADVEDSLATAKGIVDGLEVMRSDLRAKLAPLIPAGETVECGSVSLRRSVVKGRTSFAIRQFLDAGHKLPRVVAPFISQGAASERWTVTRIGKADD